MIGTRRPAGVALVALVSLALVGPIGAWGAAAKDPADAREAARLVARTRQAASQYDFSGTATVRWNTGGGTRDAQVQVNDADGAIEIVSADGTIIDAGRRTYVSDPRSTPGWTSVLVEPTARDLPAPGSRWDLSTGAARVVAGRPTTVVVATRPNGTPSQRLFVDEDTGLLLGREVLGPSGRVERSVVFDDVAIGATVTVDPPSVKTQAAPRLSSVPSGYRAPRSTGGYDLVTRSQQPNGVLLFYSDGLFTVSVLEQKGDLDWGSLPKGGTTRDVAGTQMRAYREPSGNVFVWERDGLVFTSVSDAPSDVFTTMIDDLAGGGRTTVQSVVDFVLGPFGWH